VISAVACVLLYRRRRVAEAALLPLVLAGGELLNVVLKLAFHRPRPEVALVHLDTYSFPSGHAMLSSAAYGALAYLACSRWRTTKARLTVTAGTFALVAVRSAPRAQRPKPVAWAFFPARSSVVGTLRGRTLTSPAYRAETARRSSSAVHMGHLVSDCNRRIGSRVVARLPHPMLAKSRAAARRCRMALRIEGRRLPRDPLNYGRSPRAEPAGGGT
jgi:hypothetical protein